MEDQQVAGYILGWKVMDEFHLNNIAVHSDFQRRHIGWSLIQHVINRLQSQNIQRIYLEVSGKINPLNNYINPCVFKRRACEGIIMQKGNMRFCIT